MQIIELNSIDSIVDIHEKVFGSTFPYDSYEKKCQKGNIYLYGYFENEQIVGYSIVVSQDEEKNLYAWYGGLLPKYQGHGITVKFFDMMVEKARELQYNSISLATTNCRPNMLRLAIKYGFDIYDIKKREYGEGNKIYFKYNIFPKTDITISLIQDDGSKLKVPQLEKMLVSAYKHNCNKIIFDYILDEADLEMILYAKRYCKKFLRQIKFELHGDSNLINQILD